MKLNDLLSDTLAGVFNNLEDVTPEVIYTRVKRSGIDPVTGDALTADITTSTNVRALFDKYKQSRVAIGDVTSTDYKVTVIAKMLGFTPEVGDRILKNGITYEVFLIESDPIGVSFDLGVRN